MTGAPSIAGFRSFVRSVLSRAGGRDVIVLGIDGIGYELASRSWRRGTVTSMQSVFPTTSTACWLTSLTGMNVAEHGVVGVAVRLPDQGDDIVDLLRYAGPLAMPPVFNIFSDAAELGYEPIAIPGDLEDLPSAWRSALLRHAEIVPGPRFYAQRSGPPDPRRMVRDLRDVVRSQDHAASGGGPRLIWCFIDVDLHVHRNGYDGHVDHVLLALEDLAIELANDAIVIAHSDHGLTRTNHDPAVESVLEELMARHGCVMGGAGRVRWLYVERHAIERLRRDLQDHLQPSVDVVDADTLWPPTSLARARTGDLVLVARGEGFLAPPDYLFEHGSATEDEMNAALCRWGALGSRS